MTSPRGRMQGTGLVVLILAAAWAADAKPVAAVQKAVSLTVYNSGMALVRDTREASLPQGEVRLQFPGVARQIQSSTVQIVSLSPAAGLKVLEQRYEYNLLTPESLLRGYVGKTVTIVDEHNPDKQVSAKLIAANPAPVWEIGGKIVTGLKADQYMFPRVPSALTAKPALVALVESHRAGPQEIQLSYLTNGIGWSADYVLTVARDWQTGSVSGWFTIDNRTGTAFRNAALQLVAGQVRQVGPAYGIAGGVPGRFERTAQVVRAAMPLIMQQPFAAYHLYTVERPATLANNETTQISLLTAGGVHLTRTYEVQGQTYYFHSPLESAEPLRDPVQIHLKFVNTKQNSLGVPLPEGVVRVYRNDAQERTQLIGEARIGHTPEGERLNLTIGNAFDIVAERKQTDYRRSGPNAAEMAFAITLRNHGGKPVQVMVNEPFGGDWQITDSNFPYQKTGAFSARFTVPVPAKGITVLKYRVHVQW